MDWNSAPSTGLAVRGLAPTFQENLRFIAAGRHAKHVDPEALSLLERQDSDGRTFGKVVDVVGTALVG